MLAERVTTFYHTDGLGSVVAATGATGTVQWRKSYTPYGAQIGSSHRAEPLSYTGKPHDNITGLTYFGARYFDPEVGRFMSVDPVGFVESNPMSFNRDLYVNDNPYKYVDPDGEFLNFAAKFVLDVGINVAFNYVTTGQMDVGGALKESAVGILNPAKTLAKAGKLAIALNKTRNTVGKVQDAGNGGSRLSYRAASGTPNSMTPRPHDLKGLSAADSLENALPGKNQVIDTSRLTNLCAVCDNPSTGHVSIIPRDLSEMPGWIASRGTGEVHPLTKELMDAVVDTVKK